MPKAATTDQQLGAGYPRDQGVSQVRLRWPLLSLFLGAFAAGTDGFMIAGLLPQIAHGLATTTAVAAQLVTVFAVTYAAGAPLVATLAARAAPRTVLVAALGGLCAANALAALTPGLVLLFLARITAALAASLYTPAAAVTAAALAGSQRRGRALGVVTAGLTLSIVTGVPLGTLVGDRFGWRATFAGIAVLSAVVALTVRAAMPQTMPVRPARPLRGRIALLRIRGAWPVLATTLSGIFAGYLGYTYVARISYAAGARGGASLAGILACFGVGAGCGALLSGGGADRYGQPPVVRAGAVLQAIALAALAAMDYAGTRAGVAPVAAAFTLLGAGSFVYNAPQQHRLIELAPASAATLVSLNSSAIYAGIGLSGAAGGLTLHAGPAANCLAGSLAAAVTAVLAGRHRRRLGGKNGRSC